jgi:protein-disulfide isomerase
MESNVTLIEISDFECGHCRENQELMKFLFNKYKNDVKFGYINYSSYASISALTSLAAAKQNKFWEMHDVLFNAGNLMSINEVYKLADSLNLDLRKFKSDIGSPRLLNDLELSFESIRKLGVDATPSIIINGQLVYDSYSKEEIERVIIEELNK